MIPSSHVCLVTGAASGIGLAAAKRLAVRGCPVVAVDRNAAGLAWAAEHDNVAPFTGDLTEEATAVSMVALATERFGGLDVALLVAGMSGHFAIDDPSAIAMLDRLIAVNLRGTVFAIRAVVPALRSRGGGAIVAVSSIAGLGGDEGNWAYSATKHAVVGLVRSLAQDLGPHGVRINAICPGPTRGTGMSGPVEEHRNELYTTIAGRLALRRWAEADEQAAAMDFLASPEASFINGVALPVEGGLLAATGLFTPAEIRTAGTP